MVKRPFIPPFKRLKGITTGNIIDITAFLGTPINSGVIYILAKHITTVIVITPITIAMMAFFFVLCLE